MIVYVAPEVTWLAECFALGSRHKHVSAHLLGPPGDQVLVDTGAPAHRDLILEQLETATEGAGPAAIVLTHGDLPHTGNVGPIRDRWGDVPLYAATAAPEILGFAPSIHCPIGTERTLAGRRLRFVDPPLADIRATMWVHDRETGALLTGDGLGHYHGEGHCDALDAAVSDTAIADYHRDTFAWLPYVDAGTLRSALEGATERPDVELLLPIHGRPVLGDELPGYLERCAAQLDRLTEAPLPGEAGNEPSEPAADRPT